MRRFIDIAENASSFEARMTPIVQSIADGLGYWIPPEPEGENQPVTPKAIEQTVAYLANLSKGEFIPGFRFMWLAKEKIEYLRQGAHLGRCWTNAPDELYLGALSGSDQCEEDDRVYLFSADLPVSAVDWQSTAYQRLTIPWENEIVMTNRSSIRLTGLWDIGDAYLSYKEHGRMQPVRPNLVGQMFQI